jgi:hypothetical protein
LKAVLEMRTMALDRSNIKFYLPCLNLETSVMAAAPDGSHPRLAILPGFLNTYVCGADKRYRLGVT